MRIQRDIHNIVCLRVGSQVNKIRLIRCKNLCYFVNVFCHQFTELLTNKKRITNNNEISLFDLIIIRPTDVNLQLTFVFSLCFSFSLHKNCIQDTARFLLNILEIWLRSNQVAKFTFFSINLVTRYFLCKCTATLSFTFNKNCMEINVLLNVLVFHRPQNFQSQFSCSIQVDCRITCLEQSFITSLVFLFFLFQNLLQFFHINVQCHSTLPLSVLKFLASFKSLALTFIQRLLPLYYFDTEFL